MATRNDLIVLVEGRTAEAVISHILRSAGFLDGYRVVAHDGPLDPRLKPKLSSAFKECEVWAVYDVEYGNLRDALDQVAGERDGVGRYFPAMPLIESWILSDVEIGSKLLDVKQQELLTEKIGRSGRLHSLALSLLLKKHRASPKRMLELLREYSPERAAAISPTLRSFLNAVSDRLKKTEFDWGSVPVGKQLQRVALKSLLEEVLPSSTLVFKDLDGHEYTAEEMQNCIAKGDAVGTRYAAALIRAARSMLIADLEKDDGQEDDC